MFDFNLLEAVNVSDANGCAWILKFRDGEILLMADEPMLH
jgi:hypothetical protein